ncbi:MAG: hypothetical protein WEB60_09460 [Terrimicrobiaceae bacterium]
MPTLHGEAVTFSKSHAAPPPTPPIVQRSARSTTLSRKTDATPTFLIGNAGPGCYAGAMKSEMPLERLFWWKDPSHEDPHRIAAQVMVFGDLKDIQIVREKFGEIIFEEILAAPPRGVFDRKSWVFWHKKLGKTPIPPLPIQGVSWPQ